jgi:hypothetical protein
MRKLRAVIAGIGLGLFIFGMSNIIAAGCGTQSTCLICADFQRCVREGCTGQCPSTLGYCCLKIYGPCAQNPSHFGYYSACCAYCPDNDIEC